MTLRHALHFLSPDDQVWPELRDPNIHEIDPQTLSERSGGILHNWVLRTYYQLRLIGIPVTVSSQLRPDAINVAASRDFGRKHRKLGSFVVIPQADAHHVQLADFRIMQNGLMAAPDNVAIWHWPQPGIIARDPARGTRIERLSFKGRLLNLDEAFHSDEFRTELAARGIEFEIDAFAGERGQHTWNDYAASDAVLAVRNLTEYDARKKPASKLVNAWLADLPAILGPEPAFQELRRSQYDFLEVRSPRETLEAIEHLQANPDVYTAMIKNGQTRKAEFDESAVTAMWLDALNGPIADAFEAWRRKPLWSKAAHVYGGILRENRAKADDRHAVHQGTRILDAVATQEP